ncbi:unnamed protein product [Rhodiola kirilowii]
MPNGDVSTMHYSSAMLLLLLISASMAAGDQLEDTVISGSMAAGEGQLEDAVKMAISGICEAREYIEALAKVHGSGRVSRIGAAMDDCAHLYDATHDRLDRLIAARGRGVDDGLTWLSAALAAHRTCLDGMREVGFRGTRITNGRNVTRLLGDALASYKRGSGRVTGERMSYKAGKVNNGGLLASWNPSKLNTVFVVAKDRPGTNTTINATVTGLLASWNPLKSKADFVVAKDGSGTHTTINDAVSAMSKMGKNRPWRLIVYVKAGVYNENVVIERDLKNVMFVGDGIDKTIVTGSKNVVDGFTTFNSATFGVSGDEFWARDMTFENTAGPQKHQAVALRVDSDLSVFYKCSMRAYQDTLYVHSLRQFYRDCEIHGTVDFIFGDSATVLQNCNIFVRKPMLGQSNMVTAQGRDHPDENTGIVIHASRVIPSSEFVATKNDPKSFLGRPWRQYSRTVFIKTDLDGLIHPKGWKEWKGNFALSTLYYGEYMNTGAGANTDQRVNWPGFHVLRLEEANQFSVSQFLTHSASWITATSIPFYPGI